MTGHPTMRRNVRRPDLQRSRVHPPELQQPKSPPLLNHRQMPLLRSAGDVLRLQRTVGNRATMRLLSGPAGAQLRTTGLRRATVQRRRARARAGLIQREEGVGEDTARRAASNFAHAYYDVLSELDELRTDVTGRTLEFETIFGDETIEDYTIAIVENTSIVALLKRINSDIEKHGRADPAIPERVADLLLAASLIPSRKTEQKRRIGSSRFTRQAFGGLSPARVISTLIQIDQQVVAGGKAKKTEALQGLKFGDDESVAQRLMKMSLINALPTARGAMQGDKLYQAIFDSPDIVAIVMGSSGGAIEQQFLNTCTTSAINQAVEGQVMGIAGLLQVGRSLVDHILDQVADDANAELLERKAKGLIRRQTVKQLALQRTMKARLSFAEIESQATAIVQKDPVDVDALRGLTRVWSREMQKLSALADLSVKIRKLPVLTKKSVNEQWGLSAFLAAGKGFDRPLRRAQGIDAGAMLGALEETLNLTFGKTMFNLNKQLKENEVQARAYMPRLWQNVFDMGGSPFGVKGHSLFMKAIVQGQKKVFAVGDPKIDRYEFKDMDEMARFVGKTHRKQFDVPKEAIAGSSPMGFFVRDGVPIYSTTIRLKQDGVPVATANMDTIIEKIEEKDEGGQKYQRVTTSFIVGFVKAEDFVKLE